MEEHYIVKRVSVPVHLEELMNGLTKEILKNQPKDVILFASEYFTKLLKLRDEGYTGFARTRTKSSAIKLTPRKEKQIAKNVTKPVEKLTIDTRTKPLSRQVSLHVTNVDLVSKKIDHHGIVDNYMKRKRETETKEKVVSNKGKQNNSLSDTDNVKGVKKHITSKPANKPKIFSKRNDSKSERAESDDSKRASDKFIPKNFSIEEEGKFTKGGLLAVVAPKPRKKLNNSVEATSISIPVPVVTEKTKITVEKLQKDGTKENENYDDKTKTHSSKTIDGDNVLSEPNKTVDIQNHDTEDNEERKSKNEKIAEDSKRNKIEIIPGKNEGNQRSEEKNIISIEEDKILKEVEHNDIKTTLKEREEVEKLQEIHNKPKGLEEKAEDGKKIDMSKTEEVNMKDLDEKIKPEHTESIDIKSLHAASIQSIEKPSFKTEDDKKVMSEEFGEEKMKKSEISNGTKEIKDKGLQNEEKKENGKIQHEKNEDEKSKEMEIEREKEKDQHKNEDNENNKAGIEKEKHEQLKDDSSRKDIREDEKIKVIDGKKEDQELKDENYKKDIENNKTRYEKDKDKQLKDDGNKDIQENKINKIQQEKEEKQELKDGRHKRENQDIEESKTQHEKSCNNKDVEEGEKIKTADGKRENEELIDENHKKGLVEKEAGKDEKLKKDSNKKGIQENGKIKIKDGKREEQQSKDESYKKEVKDNDISKIKHEKDKDEKLRDDIGKKDIQEKEKIKIADGKKEEQELKDESHKIEIKNSKISKPKHEEDKDEKLKDLSGKQHIQENEKIKIKDGKREEQQSKDESYKKEVKDNDISKIKHEKDKDEKLKDDIGKKDIQEKEKINIADGNKEEQELKDESHKIEIKNSEISKTKHEEDKDEKLKDLSGKQHIQENEKIKIEAGKKEEHKLKDESLKKEIEEKKKNKDKHEEDKNENLKNDSNKKDIQEKEKIKIGDGKKEGPERKDDNGISKTKYEKDKDEKLKDLSGKKNIPKSEKIKDGNKKEQELKNESHKEKIEDYGMSKTEHEKDKDEKLKDPSGEKEIRVSEKIEDGKREEQELKNDSHKEKIEDYGMSKSEHEKDKDEKLKDPSGEKDIRVSEKIEDGKREEQELKNESHKEKIEDYGMSKTEHENGKNEKLKYNSNKTDIQEKGKIKIEDGKLEDQELKDGKHIKEVDDNLNNETIRKKDKDKKLTHDNHKKEIQENEKIIIKHERDKEHVQDEDQSLKDDNHKKNIQDKEKIKIEGSKLNQVDHKDEDKKLKDGDKKDVSNEDTKIEHEQRDAVGEVTEQTEAHLTTPLSLPSKKKDEDANNQELTNEEMKQAEQNEKLEKLKFKSTKELDNINKVESQEIEKIQSEKETSKGNESDLKAASRMFLKKGFRALNDDASDVGAKEHINTQDNKDKNEHTRNGENKNHDEKLPLKKEKEEAMILQEGTLNIKNNEKSTNELEGNKVITESIAVKDIKTIAEATNSDLNKHVGSDGAMTQKESKTGTDSKNKETFVQVQEDKETESNTRPTKAIPVELKQSEEIANQEVIFEKSHDLDKRSINQTSSQEKQGASILDTASKDEKQNGKDTTTKCLKTDEGNIVKNGNEPEKYSQDQNKAIGESKVTMDKITEERNKISEQTTQIGGNNETIPEHKMDLAEAGKSTIKSEKTKEQLIIDTDSENPYHNDDKTIAKSDNSSSSELQGNDGELNKKERSIPEGIESLIGKGNLGNIEEGHKDTETQVQKVDNDANLQKMHEKSMEQNVEQHDKEVIKSDKYEAAKSEEVSKPDGIENQPKSEKNFNVGNILEPSLSNQTGESVKDISESKQLVRMKTVEEIPCEKVIVAPLIDHGGEILQSQHTINEKISHTDVETALKENEKQLEISTSGVELTPKDEKIMEEDKKSKLSIAEGKEEINGGKQTFMVSELHSSGDASNISSKNRTVHNIVPTRPAASDIAGNLIPNENKRSSGIDKHDDITANNQLQTSDSNLTCLDSNSESDIAQEHLDTMKNILLEINLEEEDKNSDQINTEEEPAISEEEIKSATDMFLRSEQGFIDKKHEDETSVSGTKNLTKANKDMKEVTYKSKPIEVQAKTDQKANVQIQKLSNEEEKHSMETATENVKSLNDTLKVENDAINTTDLIKIAPKIKSDGKMVQDTKAVDLKIQNDNEKQETSIQKVPENLKQEAEIKVDIVEKEIQKEGVTLKKITGVENLVGAKDDCKDKLDEVKEEVHKEKTTTGSGSEKSKDSVKEEHRKLTLEDTKEMSMKYGENNELKGKTEEKTTGTKNEHNLGTADPASYLENKDSDLKLEDKIDDKRSQKKKITNLEGQDKYQSHDNVAKQDIKKETDVEIAKELLNHENINKELLSSSDKDHDRKETSTTLKRGENDAVLLETNEFKLNNSKNATHENIINGKMDKEKANIKTVGELPENFDEKMEQLNVTSHDNQEVPHAKILENEQGLQSVKEDAETVKNCVDNLKTSLENIDNNAVSDLNKGGIKQNGTNEKNVLENLNILLDEHRSNEKEVIGKLGSNDGTRKKREVEKEAVLTEDSNAAKSNLIPQQDTAENLKHGKDIRAEDRDTSSLKEDDIQSVAEKMANAVQLSKELLNKLEFGETFETIKKDTSEKVVVNDDLNLQNKESAPNLKQTLEGVEPEKESQTKTPDISKSVTKLTTNGSDKNENKDEDKKKKDLKQIQDTIKKDKVIKQENEKINRETGEGSKSLIIKPVEIIEKSKLKKTRSVSITRENKKKDLDSKTPRNVDKKPMLKSFSTSHMTEKKASKTDRNHVSKSSSIAGKDKEGGTDNRKQDSEKLRDNVKKTSLSSSTKQSNSKLEDDVKIINKSKKGGTVASEKIVKKAAFLPESSKSILLTSHKIPDEYVKDILLTNGHDDKLTQDEDKHKVNPKPEEFLPKIDLKDFLQKERQFWMLTGNGKLETNLTQKNELHETISKNTKQDDTSVAIQSKIIQGTDLSHINTLEQEKKNIESPHEALLSSDQSTSDQVSSELLSSQTNDEQIYNENVVKHSKGEKSAVTDGSRLSSASSDGSNSISIQTEQLNGTSFPLSVPLNQDAAGDARVTSATVESASLQASPTVVGDVGVVGTGVVDGSTQTQIREERACGSATASSTVAQQEMDANHKARRNNSSIAHQENKNMEEVAATKIQASFRGYQVRKQLKTKNGGTEAISQGRVGRRKNSGKLRSSDVSAVSKNVSQKKDSEIEERSATKIQAGVRGFLVRRRFKKDKTNTTPGSS